MKFQLLPSSFDENGLASARQHLACFVVDDRVAVDAGSLAFSANDTQREKIRDVLLTHAHLDHIAGLPLFLDDLFSVLKEPVKIHATQEIIDVLERDIFNWSIYPRFSELSNEHGAIVKYVPFDINGEFPVAHLNVRAIKVNHRVPSVGFDISDGEKRIAITGDTANMDEFWEDLNSRPKPDVLLIECAFPDSLADLAEVSHHLTPSRLKTELNKFNHTGMPVYAINLKPMYREEIVAELNAIAIDGLQILEVGVVYDW